MSISSRLRKLEARRGVQKPRDFIWAALLTEVTPGSFAFDTPEHMQGRVVSREQLDAMEIPCLVVSFLSGTMKGRSL